MPDQDRIQKLIEEHIDDLQEIICTNIDEPAGHRYGYGMTEEGQNQMALAISSFVSKILSEK